MKSKKFILVITIGLSLIFTIMFLKPSLKKRIEWNKISEHYDIIADVSFDYYKEHINERNAYNGTIFLDISENGETLTQTIYSTDKGDRGYYVDLTEQQKDSLKNISKYYTGPKRQELIMIKSAEYLEITDDDAVGAFAVIKSKEKPSNWGNHKMYYLGNNWWQVDSTAR